MVVSVETAPDASACALAVQTCSSRKPLPTPPPFEYPMVACLAAALGAVDAPELEHAVASTATTARPTNDLARMDPLNTRSPPLLPTTRRLGRVDERIAPMSRSRSIRSIGLTSCALTPPSSPLPGEDASHPPRVFSIGVIERCPRAFGAYDRRPGQDWRQGAPLREEMGGPDLDAIDDGDGCDRRARAHRGVEAVDRAQRVGVRRSEIDDEIRLVE